LQLRFPHAAALVAAALFSQANDAHAANACVQANQEAQDLRRTGKLRESRAQLLVCAAKNCNATIRSDCEKWLKEVDDETPTVTVRVVDARGHDVVGATVTIDDARIELDGKPVQVDPGPRTIKARAKSGDVAETKALTVLKEKARIIELKFTTDLNADGSRANGSSAPTGGGATETPPPPPSPPPPYVAITLAAAGGIALGAFAFFEVTGHSAYDDLKTGCGATDAGCTDAQIDPVKGKFVAAGVSLIIATIALGGAAIVYFTGKSSAKTTALSLSPVIRF
jgi:hypothetical protein